MDITMELQRLATQLAETRGKRDLLTKQLAQAHDAAERFESRAGAVAKARTILQAVALQTQRNLTGRLTTIVGMALAAVFPDPYELSAEFVQQRGKTECELAFRRGDRLLDPMTATGGGVKDVASFAFRAAFWSLEKRARPVLIADEMFKFVSRDLQPKAARMVAELSKKLGLQIIMVTHIPEFIEVADRVFDLGDLQQGVE